MTEEQFDALIELIDAMIDYKIIGGDHSALRKMQIEKDTRELLVKSSNKVLGEKK